LSSNTYRVIKPPPGYEPRKYPAPYLQKSEKGVYYVSLDNYLLQVWILKESCDQTEWVLKHENDLEPVMARYCPHQFRGFWMLKGIKHNSFCIHFPKSKEDIAEEKFEWSSDRENVLENEDKIVALKSVTPTMTVMISSTMKMQLRTRRKQSLKTNLNPTPTKTWLKSVTQMKKIHVRLTCSGFTHSKRCSSSVNQPR
jgi:hypothetical protein